MEFIMKQIKRPSKNEITKVKRKNKIQFKKKLKLSDSSKSI